MVVVGPPKEEERPHEQRKTGLLEGKYAKAKNGLINYQLWGPDDKSRPLVVTVHGLLGSMAAYAGVAQELVKQGFEVLTFDLYGFGLSKSPRKRFNTELYVQQTLELLELVGYPSDYRFFLIGFSMGGLVALDLTRTVPQRIRRLLLVAPAGLIHLSTGQQWGIRLLNLARVLHIPVVTLAAKLARCRKVKAEDFAPDGIDPVKCEEAAERNAKMFRSNPEKYAEAWLKSVRDMRLAGNQQLYKAAAECGVEVLFIWGDCDGMVPLEEVQEDLRTIFPQAPVLVVQGAAHSVLNEQSGLIAYHANGWFAQAPPVAIAPPPMYG